MGVLEPQGTNEWDLARFRPGHQPRRSRELRILRSVLVPLLSLRTVIPEAEAQDPGPLQMAISLGGDERNNQSMPCGKRSGDTLKIFQYRYN